MRAAPGDKLNGIADTGSEREREVASEAIFFALFRVVEIEELSGAEKAVEWARGMVDDPAMRRALGDGVLRSMSERRSDERDG